MYPCCLEFDLITSRPYTTIKGNRHKHMQNHQDNPIVTGSDIPDSFLGKVKRLVWPAGVSLPYKIAVLVVGAIILLLSTMLVVIIVHKSDHVAMEQNGQESSQGTGDTPNGDTRDRGNENDPTKEDQKTDDNKAKKSSPSSTNPGGGSGTGGSSGAPSNGGGDPVPTGVCQAFPAFPDANCTGWQHTGVALQSCATTLSTDNAVYDGCLFDGGIVVVGNNITVKRSKITGIVSANWDANGSLRGLSLVDVEIDGSPYFDPFGQAAIGLDNYTCIRCHVHNTGRGANFRNNVRIEDSYFHDFVYVDGAHQSAIGSNGGSNNTILHNNIECNGVGGSGCSGALVMYGDFDPIDNILVQNNLFNTDGSYCTYAGSTGVSSGKPFPHGTNVRYIDNRFGKKYYSTCGDAGPVAAWEYNSGNVWSGNSWADGSGGVNP